MNSQGNYMDRDFEKGKELEKLMSFFNIEFSIIRNPNLIRFMRRRGIPAYSPIEKMFSKEILMNSIKIEQYDRRFQGYLEMNSLKYFFELEQLIDESLECDSIQTRTILKKFLDLNAIKTLLKAKTNTIMDILTSNELLELEQKCPDKEEVSKEKIIQEIGLLVKRVKNKSAELLKYPSEFEKVAIEILNRIKNNYETLKYITGLLRALFDLLENSLQVLEIYFNSTKSVSQHYFRPKSWRGLELWLKDHLQKEENIGKYNSIKIIFEDWIYETFDKLRHFESHGQKDVSQDKLAQGIYKVRIKEDGEFKIKEYTIEELKSYYEISFDLLLLNKHVIAQKYFTNEQGLFTYLSSPYDIFEEEPFDPKY